MLKKISIKVTSDLYSRIKESFVPSQFLNLKPIIDKAIVSAYLQGRMDQANKVEIIQEADGSLTFP